MPPEVDNQRNRAAQNDGRRKYIAYGWNTKEKYQHAADRENCSSDASTDRNLRQVNLRRVFSHGAPSSYNHAITA